MSILQKQIDWKTERLAEEKRKEARALLAQAVKLVSGWDYTAGGHINPERDAMKDVIRFIGSQYSNNDLPDCVREYFEKQIVEKLL